MLQGAINGHRMWKQDGCSIFLFFFLIVTHWTNFLIVLIVWDFSNMYFYFTLICLKFLLHSRAHQWHASNSTKKNIQMLVDLPHYNVKNALRLLRCSTPIGLIIILADSNKNIINSLKGKNLFSYCFDDMKIVMLIE